MNNIQKATKKVFFLVLLPIIFLSNLIMATKIFPDFFSKLLNFPHWKVGMAIAFLLMISVPNKTTIVGHFGSKLKSLILCLWEVIYRNNEAKIYSFIIVPIVLAELLLIIFFPDLPPRPKSIFFVLFVSLYGIWLALTIRTKEDQAKDFFPISDQQISDFLNYPFRKIYKLFHCIYWILWGSISQKEKKQLVRLFLITALISTLFWLSLI